MPAKGDLMLAWAVDPLIRERGESGGAVTALLTFALAEGIVDAVVGVEKAADIYDARPVLITDPHEVMDTEVCPRGHASALQAFWEIPEGLERFKSSSCLQRKRCDGDLQTGERESS